jgi:hypothetical protein
MRLQNTIILAKRKQQMDWILKEAIKIDLHPNMNREDGFCLRQTWKLFICDVE